jgi:hypothetical protein
MAFEQVSMDEFDKRIARSPSSKVFKKRIARFSSYCADHCFVHHGALLVPGHFTAPGLCTLVIGDLDVGGVVNLNNPDGFDEGGVFIVIGNVTCKGFANHYGKSSFVDGDLVASDVIVNAFEDSSLVVTGNLKTKFFYGRDIWAEVGGRADMKYGNGYCLPIGYKNAAEQAIEPQHDLESSMGVLADSEDALTEREFVTALKQDLPIFKW